MVRKKWSSRFSANTLGYYNNSWWYVRNGCVDFNANTLGYYNNNWWYVRNGRVDFNANTLGIIITTGGM